MSDTFDLIIRAENGDLDIDEVAPAADTIWRTGLHRSVGWAGRFLVDAHDVCGWWRRAIAPHDEYHDEYLEDLGVAPQRLRVYHVGDDVGDGMPWQADAIATFDGKIAISQACVNFSTWAEAMAYLPSLWADLAP